MKGISGTDDISPFQGWWEYVGNLVGVLPRPPISDPFGVDCQHY
jgi:hypothetical protein